MPSGHHHGAIETGDDQHPTNEAPGLVGDERVLLGPPAGRHPRPGCDTVGTVGGAADDEQHAPTLADVERMLRDEHGLLVVSTTTADGRVLSSVVNCGVIEDPVTGKPAAAFVSNGRSARNRHLRDRPAITLTVRRGWAWLAVTGIARLIGPDDDQPGFGPDEIRLLVRQIFASAGGTHDDLDEFDRVMHRERRVAVIVTPDRIYGNTPAR